MGRPIPQGRDRVGILGWPFGGNIAALTGTDSEYQVGTNDFMMEAVAVTDVGLKGDWGYWITVDKNVGDPVKIGYRIGNDSLNVYTGNSHYLAAPSGFTEHRRHVMCFADRSGNAYWYVDGSYFGSVDISGDAANNLGDAGDIEVGGGHSASYWVSKTLSRGRLIIFSGTFPTADERAAIAMERYLNPDAESPTLAARAAYATERRLDVDFDDTVYSATTVANHGTGGDLTINAGLSWHDVSSRPERVPRSIPARTYYHIIDGQSADEPGQDFGFAVRPVIVRMYTGTLKNDRAAGSASTAYIRNNSGNDRIILQVNSTGSKMRWAIRRNGVYTYEDLCGDDLGGGDLWLVCNGTSIKSYLSGQLIKDFAIASAMDLSGTARAYMSGVDGTQVCRMAVWNPSSVPATLAQEIRDCCMDVESDPPSLGTPLVDFPLRDGVISGTSIPNQGSGGGALTLTSATGIRVMLRGL